MGLSWGLVPPDEVCSVWPTVSQILAKAVDRDEGRRTLEDVFRDLIEERNQLWIVADNSPLGVVVTSVLLYPRKRVLKVEWLAGERFEEWAHLIGVLESYARDVKCSAVEIAGRMGFARIFKKHGYEITGFEGSKNVQPEV